MRIIAVHARQVLDSRGNPTVEAVLSSELYIASAIVPSGASTGKYEALELRDHKKAYGGKSVLNAVTNIEKKIRPAITDVEFSSLSELDALLLKLDGTPNKSKLGANALLAVSMAAARLFAQEKKQSLYAYLGACADTKPADFRMPIPFANVINGGKHAGSPLKIQEFMIAPTGATSFAQAAQMVSETYHALKSVIEKKYGKAATNVGDEGGFAPQLSTPEEALDLLVTAISTAGYARKIKIAMDAAASEFYDEKQGMYVMNKSYTREQLIDYYLSLCKNYPIISIEDPFDQDDFDAFQKLTERAKKIGVRIIGDDLLVTNPQRINSAVKGQLCNGLLLKVNQIGTVTEALQAAQLAKNAGWTVMVSHRSGETEDAFIADLATGLGCGQIKLGAPCRTDRVAKYNQLLRLEEQQIPYAGKSRFFSFL